MRTRYDFTLYVQCLFVNLITTNVFMERQTTATVAAKKMAVCALHRYV